MTTPAIAYSNLDNDTTFFGQGAPASWQESSLHTLMGGAEDRNRPDGSLAHDDVRMIVEWSYAPEYASVWRSTDGGTTWSWQNSGPSVGYGGTYSRGHLSYKSGRYTATKAYMGQPAPPWVWRVISSYSDDDGVTWSSPVVALAGTSENGGGAIAADEDGDIYAVLNDARNALVFSKSTDGGATWGAPVSVATGLSNVRYVSIGARSGHVFIAWSQNLTDGIYIHYSHDDGDTWSAMAGTIAGLARNFVVGVASGALCVATIADGTSQVHRYLASNWQSGEPSFAQTSYTFAGAFLYDAGHMPTASGDSCPLFVSTQETATGGSVARLYCVDGTGAAVLVAENGEGDVDPIFEIAPAWARASGAPVSPGTIRFHAVASDMAVTVPEPMWGDRGAWASGEWPDRHTIEALAAEYTLHVPPPGAVGGLVRSDGTHWQRVAALSHSELSGVGASDHHNPVTLDANADTVLSLSTQALGLDTQTANTVLAGPTVGAAAVPTFRALHEDDLPAHDHGGGSAASGYAASVGDGGTASFDVTHSLNTTDVLAQVWDTGGTPRQLVDPDLYVVDADTVRVSFSTTPSANQYRVVIIGVETA